MEAAVGLSINEIVPLWKAYLKDLDANKQDFLTLPPSTILEDEASFVPFAARHHLRISEQENPNAAGFPKKKDGRRARWRRLQSLP